MASRKFCFDPAALKARMERYASWWVLYALASDMSDIQSLNEGLFGQLGGKNYAVQEISLS